MKRHELEHILRAASAITDHPDDPTLGAWGCGVFRNDPRTVARLFAELLKPPGRFASAFDEVVFAVFDRSENEVTYRAFATIFP